MSVFRLNREETRAAFRKHFGGEPEFADCPCGCGNWVAYRTARVPEAPRPALWIQGSLVESADDDVRELPVLGLENEDDLQAWLEAARRKNSDGLEMHLLDDQLSTLAAQLRPHLPGPRGN